MCNFIMNNNTNHIVKVLKISKKHRKLELGYLFDNMV